VNFAAEQHAMTMQATPDQWARAPLLIARTMPTMTMRTALKQLTVDMETAG
jgi:hypothetical protein